MYRVFVYRVDDESRFGLYIEDEFEYNTFEEALKRFVIFDDDLSEIAKDEPWFDGSCNVTQLKTVARSAPMKAFVNSYFSRW